MSRVICVTVTKHSLQLSVTNCVYSSIFSLLCNVINSELLSDVYITHLDYSQCGSLVFNFRSVFKEFKLVLPFV